MKRAFAIIAVTAWILAAVVMHSAIKDFLSSHTWWHNLLVSLPTIAVPILAWFELRHSAEANKLRKDNNKLHDEANELRKEANNERTRANEALASIAHNTKKALTKAERNADKLQKYLRSKAQVMNADDSRWPEAAEIVDINDEVVTLFTPCGRNSSTAIEYHVHCESLEISDLALRMRTPYALGLRG